VSRAARCWSSWTISTLALLALTGCGSTWHAAFDAHGIGKDQYWVVHAKGNPKAVVVLLHGLGRDSGEQLQPWQVHLAERGYDVI
jgi:predicted alpha/beta-fold hydrolase